MDERTDSKKRVLVVDDEPRVGNVLRIKLKISGYAVITVTNGQDALKAIEAENPDIVVLDILLPDMDGFEMLKRLRSFSQLPVIVFSARPDYGKQAISLGANAFIAKPLDPDKMVKKVKDLLDRQ